MISNTDGMLFEKQKQAGKATNHADNMQITSITWK